MRHSNFIVLVSVAVGVMLGIGAATAADLPARTYTKAPVMADPVTDWSGFYIGGDIGWVGSRQAGSLTGSPSPGFGAPRILGAGFAGAGILPNPYVLKGDSFLGSVHAGYNWQRGTWLLGIEGDFSFMSLNNAANLPIIETVLGTNVGTLALSSNTHWLASARARVGYAWNKWMVYGTGGAAWTDTSYNMTYTPAGVFVPPIIASNTSFSQNKTGFVVGAGAEYMLTANWLMRLEYLYYGFNGTSGSLPLLVTGGGPACAAPGCNFNTGSGNLQFQTVRAGISYKFGGPVVARY